MRLVTLAIGGLTMLFFAIVSLQMQLERTQSKITLSGNTGDAFNMSKTVLADVTTSLGVATPGFFLAAIVAFIAVLLTVVLAR